MNNIKISNPADSEYAPYYGHYVSLVEGNDLISALENQIDQTTSLLATIPGEKGTLRYAEGKWSIKELVGHLIDTERVMAYRALRFSRNDTTELEGFDQDPYIENADFDSCKLSDLIKQFELVRRSNILMFKSFSVNAWNRSGIASGNSVSVRGLGYIIAGHEVHHINILKERYLDQ
jgi:hypothetical protein